MRSNLGLPCLGLLGFLALASLPSAALADPATPVIHAGLVKIALDPDAVSFLPIDTSALRQNGLCSGHVLTDGWGTLSPRGECDLSVGPPPPIRVYVSDAVPDSGSFRLSAQPGGSTVWAGSAPVDTPCGLWDVSMVLDPDETQPVSKLALEISTDGPSQGVFSGVMNLAVHYRFVNRNQKVSLAVPAVVPLELSGHWAAVPEGGPSLGPGASNLVLFAGALGGPEGQWSSVPSCGSAWVGGRCHICTRPPSGVVDTLNLDPWP